MKRPWWRPILLVRYTGRMHFHEIMIGPLGNVLCRRPHNSMQLDQDGIKALAEGFPDWAPDSLTLPTKFPGIAFEFSFSRNARSAGILVFTVGQAGIASSAFLSGFNAREDFAHFMRGLVRMPKPTSVCLVGVHAGRGVPLWFVADIAFQKRLPVKMAMVGAARNDLADSASSKIRCRVLGHSR